MTDWLSDGAQPSCPECRVVMRPGVGGDVCPECGRVERYVAVERPVDGAPGLPGL